MSHKTIGAILLDSGKITQKQANLIFEQQAIDDSRFGDAAIKLGYVEEKDIKFAISNQFNFSYLFPNDERVDPCLISAFVTEGPQVEAFKTLRTQLSLRWFEENKSIVVCSPVSGCGSSYVSANLSVLFAQAGKRTLLIDANFRHPSQHLCFRHKNQYGFSQILADNSDLSVIEGIDGLNHLHVLFTGATPPNPAELLERHKFAREHKLLEDNFDVLIYDAPPINTYSDTQLLLSVVGGGLLIAKKEETQINDLKLAKQKIENVRAVPVGVVLNEFK